MPDADSHPRPSTSGSAFTTHFLAGGIAGCAVEAAFYPLDTVKTCIQASKPIPPLAQLYRGVGANLAGAFPATAVFIVVYEEVRQRLGENEGTRQGWSKMASSATAAVSAGFAASALRVPTEVIKQNLQAGNFASITDAVRGVVRSRGVVGGLFAGYASFMARELPFDTIEFCSYESFRRSWTARTGHEPNAFVTTALGTVAGAFTGYVTTPMDVIKTKLMTETHHKGIIDCATQVVREGGPVALLRGAAPRCLWIALGGGVFFTALEESRVAVSWMLNRSVAPPASLPVTCCDE
ncbi:hypothetical protein PPROV_000184900 [Pycnococcus provasolii]|uniref:Mitochondrial carrier protein n=1 Tax=Pycnococcus provasolii TaxID=41880 RepID=A0A830H7Q2_9CHLO|nr:hypothetical protein PPROV_000184900 [Pycnococcus provasolii]